MDTKNTTASAAASSKKATPIAAGSKPAAEQKAKKDKRVKLTLVAPGEEFQIVNEPRDGKFTVYAIHITVDPKTEKKNKKRGASQTLDTLPLASEAFVALKEKAMRAGWKEKGKKADKKADQFTLDTIPAPGTTPRLAGDKK